MAAKKKKKGAPKRVDPAEALAQIERPEVKWKIVLQVAVAFIVIWALALGLVPWVGYWGVGGAGILTAVAAGFGIYLWRMTRKSQGIVDILKTATDEEGRKKALEKLSGKGKDAMAALAKAQLMAQESPQEAMKVLEGIDMKKAPALVQDDIRANLAMLYLMHGRAKEARTLADEIKLDRQAQPKAKAMYVAVVAESFARTGKPSEALKLLETLDVADPDYGEMGALLLRSQVYTYFATKKRGLAKKSMQKLAAIDPNMVASFAMRGANPHLAKMARQVVQASGAMPKQKMRVLRR